MIKVNKFYRTVPLHMLSLFTACQIAAVSAEEAKDNGPEFGIEKIEVTARKTVENLQDIPISVSAINGENLKSAGVLNSDSLFDFTPGATNIQMNKSQPAFSIRGVSSSSESVSGDSSVAFYQDGIYIARLTGQSFKYFDVSRIEVLRGPQGTVFGKNAAAGAVQLLTNSPHSDFEARVSAGIGNYGAYELDGMVNGTIADNTYGRLAVSTSGRDGYTTNLLTGNDIDGEQNISYRGQVLFDFDEVGELLLRAESINDDDGTSARVVIGPDPYQPSSPAGGFTLGPLPSTGDIRTTYMADDGFMKREITTYSAELTLTFDDIDMTSITAYRNTVLDQEDSLWPTYGPGPNQTYDLLHDVLLDDAEQVSQEVRFSYRDDNFSWLAGAFYMKEDLFRDEVRALHVDREGAGTGQLTDLISKGNNTTNSWAVFGELGFQLADDHRITAGLRYSADEKNINYTNGDIQNATAKADWSAVTGGLTYTYNIDKNKSAYASFNRGHKPGGFNTDAESAELLAIPFNEEIIDSFELGLKSEWLDSRLRMNTAIFSMIYKDRQTEVFIPELATQVIANTGETTHLGFETDLEFMLTENLKLTANFSYVDSEITKAEDVSIIGNEPTGAPKTTYMLAADYYIPMDDNGTIMLGAMYNYRDSAWLEEINEASPFRMREEAALVNAHIDWVNVDEDITVSLYARNLLDEEYIIHAMPFGTPGDMGGPVAYGSPRTFGLSATLSF